MEMEEKVESVFNFLKNNGLFEAEKALREEMIGSKIEFEVVDDGFDFERFLFPMLPPPPPVRVPASGFFLRSENSVENCSKASSLDEFVSLGSSSSNLCSSEFTNPYGVHSTTGGNSKASSESLSAFDTARDCHGFDMQNDQYWYDEKDESHFMTPCFNGGFDPFCCQSEDKFVTTLETEKSYGNLASSDHEAEVYSNYSEKNVIMTSTDDANKVTNKLNEYGLDDIEVKVVDEAPNKIYFAFSQKLNINADHFINMGSTKNVYDVKDDECGNSHEHESEAATDNEDGVSADELFMYNTHEDEYEVFYLRIIHRKNRTGFEENKELPIVLNTLIAGRYYVTEYLGSAAFSRVVQAHDYYTGVDVCLKIIKNDKDFFDQSLDEIKLLKYVNKYDPADEHHILRLYDYFYHQEHLFIVCELLRANLYEFQEFNRDSDGEFYFTLSRLQIIARQCLEALEFLHDLGVIHCDLKPENILVKSYKRCEIKIIDLGSSCFKTDNLCLYVQSRSYRAPEVILGLPYDQKIDIWSLGCILAELCSGEVLFPNDPLVMILARMIRILGPMDLDMLVQGQETDKYFTRDFDLYHTNEETNQLEYIILEQSSLEKHLQVSDIDFIDFIKYLLQYDPERRPTAKEALQHPWLSHSYV